MLQNHMTEQNDLDCVQVRNDSATSAPIKGGCRFCGTPLRHSVVDLGTSPLCESFLTRDQLKEAEPFYPLHAVVCEKCFLVQVEEYVSGERIFGGEYAYFSSYSDSWLAHAKRYVDMIVDRLELDEKSLVVELASNDGYLLQNMVAKGIPCLGIEPADNVAETAIVKGVPTRVEFFGVELAEKLVAEKVAETKRGLLEFLIEAKRDGKNVAAYGAPGKGNTLLNYCGIREDFLDYVVDRNPYKHGKFLPGTHIPVFAPERIAETKPDYVLILPWNLKEEIIEQLQYVRQWNAKFVIPIPKLTVC